MQRLPLYTVQCTMFRLLLCFNDCRVFKDEEVHTIEQFHYLKWPDFGCPKVTTDLLDLVKVVREKLQREQASSSAGRKVGPTLVHCRFAAAHAHRVHVNAAAL